MGDLGGNLYSVGTGFVGTTSGSKHGSANLGDAIADAPLIDSTAGTVYAFVTTGVPSFTGYNVLYQFTTAFTAYGTPGDVALWTAGGANGGAGYYLYDGDFDNVYYQSTNHTGSLYVVANTGVTTGASLFRVPITSSSLGTPVAAVTGLTASGAYPWPSSATEFCNGTCTTDGTKTTSGTDLLFFSVNQGTASGCTSTAGNGCILAYDITDPAAVAIEGTGLNVD